MNIRRIATLGLALAVLIFAPALVRAQDSSSLAGVVTDATGAVIRGVDVLLIDTKTNTTYHAVTGSVGAYTIPGILPGPGYKVTFSSSGFQSFTVTDMAIGVGLTRTQNARLVAGAAIAVEVSADSAGATLNTTDASIGNNLDVKLLTDLPVQVRNSPSALFNLQPGIANGSVTGARTDQSAVTLDGLDVNDIASGGTFATVAGRAPVDSIQEFRVTVAGELPSNGPGGGGQFQLVTKSGTNTFHGNINEYHRDTAMTANTWFNNNTGLKRTPLIRNQFGGNIGGPVLKDKLFFFFNFLQDRIVQSTSVSTTVPLDSYRNGTINYINNSIDPATGAACGAGTRLNVNPTCVSNLSSAGVAALDPQHIGFNPSLLAFINARYPRANDLTLGNGINTGGFRFTTPTPTIESDYTGRVDYNLSKTMKIYGRGSVTRDDATQTAIQFPGDPVTHPYLDRTYSYVFGHIWTIGNNKTNQFIYGDTVEEYSFPTNYRPTGITYPTIGTLTNPYASYSSQQRRVPIPVVRDDFYWQKGAHNLSFGGTFKPIKTHSSLVSDFNTVGIGIGGNLPTLNATLRPANIRAAGTTSASVYDAAFTDALGRISSISSSYNYTASGTVLPQGTGAVRRYRFFQTELYASDSWRASKQLTLTLGLRYQLYSVPYETTGLESIQQYSFNQYFSARVASAAAGKAGPTAAPLLQYNLGGKANNAAPFYQPSYKDFAPRVAFAYNPTYFPKLVINGEAGILYDRTVINAVNFIADQSSYLFQQVGISRSYGVADPTASLLADPRIGANFASPAPPTSPAIAKPYTPGVDASNSPVGLANNLFQTAIDPTLKDPYNITYNLGIQQELPAHFIMKISYVGRLGRRLLGLADGSQLIDFADPASQQKFSQAFAYLTTQARAGTPVANVAAQPFLENQVGAGQTKALYTKFVNSYAYLGDFADFTQYLFANTNFNYNIGLASQFAADTFVTNKGFSSYNGLLFTLQKNLSQGLRFDFNYTWSHSVDNGSLPANSIPGNTGYGFICDVTQPRACRGNSDFDVTHVINGDFTYELPFGHNRMFGARAPIWLDEAFGGWNVSGLPSYRSGFAYNATSGAYLASYANNAPAIFNGDKSGTAPHPHRIANGTTNASVNLFANPTAAVADYSGPVGLQYGSRNNLRGPRSVAFDASLSKRFRITPERVSLTLKGDAFNVLNHPVFSGPATDITSPGTFGQITSTAVAARVLQVSGRIEF